MQAQCLSQEDPLEEGEAPHSSILAWRITWAEEPGRIQSIWSQESDMTEVTQYTRTHTQECQNPIYK